MRTMRLMRLMRVSAFAVVLVLPLVMMWRSEGALSNEQRVAAARPVVSTAGWQYPEQFDAYFRDHFGWRSRLIRWHNLFKFRVLRQSPVPTVIVGRDRWLFYTAIGDGVDMRDFAGRWPSRPVQFEAWLLRQEARAREFEELGARYLVAIAPNKQTMYPELVPPQYGPHARGIKTAFLRRAQSHTGLDILDLEPELRPHLSAQLYYRGDSHWNANGAFYAAQAIANRLRRTLPNVGQLREEDYVVQPRPTVDGDLVRMLALDLKLPDQAFDYVRRTRGALNIRNDLLHKIWVQDDPRLPKAVVIGDSFGVALAPRLAEAFSRLHFYFMSQGGTDPNLVRDERPDVVIRLTVERFLPVLGEW